MVGASRGRSRSAGVGARGLPRDLPFEGFGYARPGVTLAPAFFAWRAGLPVVDHPLVGGLGLRGELRSASRIACVVAHTPVGLPLWSGRRR